jgi:hypothetical protein
MKKFYCLAICILMAGICSAAVIDPAATGKLVLGFDGSSVVANSGAVTQWIDQVGDYDAAGSATLVSVDTGNGLHDVLSFNGTQSLRTSAFSTALSQTNVIFIVAEMESPIATRALVDGLSSSSRNALYTRSDGSYGMYAGSQIINGNVIAQTGVFQVYTAIYAGTTSQLRIDGTKVLGIGNVGTASLNGLSIAANYNNVQMLNGKIAEVLVYHGGLNTAQIETVEGYLQSKYIIPEPATMALLLVGFAFARFKK